MIGHEVVSYNERIRRNIFISFVVVSCYFEYEEKSTEKNILPIISGVIGGAALLLGLLAALLLFKSKQERPLPGDGFERALTDFPTSPSLNRAAHSERVVR